MARLFLLEMRRDVKEDFLFPLSMASPFCPGWKAGKSIWFLLKCWGSHLKTASGWADQGQGDVRSILKVDPAEQ